MAASLEAAGARAPAGLRERGKRRRTERILDSALELLREDPEQTPTIERISERAEVAPMTIFNLVGNREQMWSAMADRALRDLDLESTSADDPQERAHRIVDAVVKILCADAEVFRALLPGWRLSGRMLEHDPTNALTECLQEAADAGMLARGVDVHRYGEILAAGLLGTIHQWSAGLIGDRAFRKRAGEVVDIVFAAARHGND